MDFLDELRIEDLNAEQRELADTLGGLDIYISILSVNSVVQMYMLFCLKPLQRRSETSTYGKSSTAATTRNLHASTVYRK